MSQASEETLLLLKFVARLNIRAMLVTEPVFQLPTPPLNKDAPRNISSISLTARVFQAPQKRSPLSIIGFKADAEANILFIDVTAAVFHLPTPLFAVPAPLNATAPSNMDAIEVTEEVSQLLMSWSNVVARYSMYCISTTLLVSHE